MKRPLPRQSPALLAAALRGAGAAAWRRRHARRPWAARGEFAPPGRAAGDLAEAAGHFTRARGIPPDESAAAREPVLDRFPEDAATLRRRALHDLGRGDLRLVARRERTIAGDEPAREPAGLPRHYQARLGTPLP